MSGHMTRHLGLAAVCCALIAQQPLAPAAAETETQLHIHQVLAAEYPNVRLLVSVLDDTGAPIHGLQSTEFSVSEDDQGVGEPECREMRPGDEMMAVALVIDRSGSMRGQAFAQTIEAVSDFVIRLSENDVCAVMPFSSRPDEPLAFTSDHDAIADFVGGLRVGGNTALHDAIIAAGQMLAERNETHKALVVLTDGIDTASAVSLDEAIDAVTSSALPVYCIGLGPDVNAEALEAIGTRTGGATLFAAGPEDLVAIYRRMLAAVQSRYELSYESPELDTPIRTARVRFALNGAESVAERTYRVPVAGGNTGARWDPVGLGLTVAVLANLLIGAAVVISRRRRRGRER